MIRTLRRWARAMFRRDGVERDLDEEIRLHVQQHAETLMARGMDRDTAMREARRQFGNTQSIKESARDARGVRFFDEVRQDVRYGLRALARSPGFTAVIVTTLALGFGVNAALFSVFRAAMRPSEVHDRASFVALPFKLSYPDFEFVRDNIRSLHRANIQSTEWVVLGARDAGEEPTRVIAELVTDEFFSSLDGRAQLGRTFLRDEVSPRTQTPVVVFSERFWRTRFGSDSSVVGSTVRLGGGTSFTVIGVMPREFIGTSRNTPDAWLPIGVRPLLPVYYNGASDGNWFRAGGMSWLTINARVAPGFTMEQVQAELRAMLVPRLRPQDREYATSRIAMLTAPGGATRVSNGWNTTAVFGATLAVLLVACATVANLMLARGAARRREIAVRLSLGASRWRIVRQLLTESLLLSIGAGALGVFFGWAAVNALVRAGWLATVARGTDPELFSMYLRPDTTTALFAFVLAIACTGLIGLVPALRTTRTPLASTIKEDTAGAGENTSRSRLRGALVLTQVAVTVVLLVSGGLLLRAVVRANTVDLGFDRRHLLSISTSLYLSGYDRARRENVMREVEERLTALPGVRAMVRGSIPLAQRMAGELSIAGRSTGDTTGTERVFFNGVTANYFDAAGVRILRGRGFTSDEVRQQLAVVIPTAATVARLWPGVDPIGKVVSIAAGGKSSGELPADRFRTAVVVGVASDAQMITLGEVDRAYFYVPSSSGSLMLRTTPVATALAPQVRAMLRAIDPALLSSATPVDESIATTKNGVEEARTAAGFAMSVGLLSLALAIVGLFGLTSYSVAQRTREFGIRIALGAPAASVRRLAMRNAVAIVAVGVVIGVSLSFFVSRVLRAFLFGLSAVDPTAYLGVSAGLLITAAIACYIPARRATRVNPVDTLRSS